MARLTRTLLVAVLVGVFAAPTLAHDFWINKKAYKNIFGEWCCGANDCGEMVSGKVTPGPAGYEVDGVFRIDYTVNAERTVKDVPFRGVIPYAEALPSPVETFSMCFKPDGGRRCFFAPPSGS